MLFAAMLNRQKSYATHHLLLDFKETNLPQDADSYLQYRSSVMTDEGCRILAEATDNQAKCYLWFDSRYGRVTGSKVHEASRCNTPDGSLSNSILGAHKAFDTEAMERGRSLEKAVLQEVESRIGEKIEKTGFVMRKEFPAFGASPDGILRKHIVEVKCPSSEHTVSAYLDQNLEPTKKYKSQMMLQMMMCKKSRGYFCVASPDFETSKKVTIVEVKFDKEYTRKIVGEALQFWKKYIFPILYQSC